MEIKGIVDAIPAKKMSPAVARTHPDIVEILAELERSDAGDTLEISYTGETDTADGDIKKASVRALALRKKGYAATTRGTSVFVTKG